MCGSRVGHDGLLGRALACVGSTWVRQLSSGSGARGSRCGCGSASSATVVVGTCRWVGDALHMYSNHTCTLTFAGDVVCPPL